MERSPVKSNNGASESRPLLFRIFFFAAFAFLLYQLLRIMAPFFEGILVAITLALVFYPVHGRFMRLCRGRPNLAAVASVVTLFMMVVVPTLFFLGLLGRQTAALYPWVEARIQEIRQDPQANLENRLPAPIRNTWNRAQELMSDSDMSPRDILLGTLESVGGKVSTLGTALVKNVFVFIFQTVIMIFTLFFVFRDGPRLADRVVHLIPMETSYKLHIVHRISQTLSAVVRGMFLTAAIQGLLAGIGFLAVGVPFSVVLGFTSAFFALIPFVGATVVWVPVGAFLFFNGHTASAIGIWLWGALVVSMVDNFLRPLLIGEKAKLPMIFLFFGTLGGIQAFGPIGLLVGPLTVATVMAFAKIYGEQLPPPGHANPQ